MAGKVTEYTITTNGRKLKNVSQKYDCRRYEYVSTAFEAPDVQDIIDSL
jgi:hypothetical protein